MWTLMPNGLMSAAVANVDIRHCPHAQINVAMRQRSIGHRGRRRGDILRWLRWPVAQVLRFVQVRKQMISIGVRSVRVLPGGGGHVAPA